MKKSVFTTFFTDYNIFFAVSQKSGKDASGNYVFMKNKNDEVVLDSHDHPKIEHDLESM